MVKYKSELRKDFFGDLPGVVGVHGECRLLTFSRSVIYNIYKQMFFISIHSFMLGEQWREFRSRVQKPVLQLSTVRRYVKPLEKVTDDFLQRCTQHLLDEKNELPHDFSNEIHKWSLECIGLVALDTRFGCLDEKLDPKSEPQQIINAAQFVLRNIAILELKAPYWRWFPSISPMWKRYVANMDYFVE